jgi:hypothetical protein
MKNRPQQLAIRIEEDNNLFPSPHK